MSIALYIGTSQKVVTDQIAQQAVTGYAIDDISQVDVVQNI